MPPRFDAALIEAARGGDRGAILALLEATQPDIRRYARRSCSTLEDADDAVQETLWLLYRKVGALRAIGSLSGWLLAVVRRHCLRLASRALGRSRDVGLDDAESDPLHAERFATWPLDELRSDVSRAIESLPPHYREVVLLRDIEEMTVDEIGGVLSISREAVKGRLHRARSLLREYLTD